MKKLLTLFLILLPVNVYALTLPEVYSEVTVVYDLTEDKELFNYLGDERKQVASLTKMATIITLIDKIPDLKSEITITYNNVMSVNPELSVFGLHAGDVYSKEDLLYMCMLRSAADACIALAQDVSGSETEFAKLMNEKVKEIGLTNTNFVNVTGLDANNQYSTANDLVSLLKYSLKNETFRDVFTSKKYTLITGEEIKPSLTGWAHSLGFDLKQIIGDKTGYTDIAGLCLASLLKIEDHEMIMITLNAPPDLKEGYHVQDANTLLQYLDENYNYETLFGKGDILEEIKVDLSKENKYKIMVTKDIKKFLPSDYDKSLISYKYEGKKELNYLDIKGKKIGELFFYYDGELLNKQDVVIDHKIEASIPKILNRYKIQLISMLLLFILLIILIIALIKITHKKVVKTKKK